MLDFSKLDIQENFSISDAGALVDLVNHIGHEDIYIVEVGSWKGYSTAWLASSIQRYGGMIYAVDHWQGNENTNNVAIAQKFDIYEIFERNIKTLGLWEFVTPMKMDSLKACEAFTDNSLDMVFLDADHRYEQFKADVSNWWSKVKTGGILCGHDCEGKYTSLSEERKRDVDIGLESDFSHGLHPGIIKVLYEQFNDDYFVAPISFIWYKQKRI